MKRNIRLILQATLTLATIGCQTPPDPNRPGPYEPIYPNSVFTGFGSPGLGQIEVIAMGCLEHVGIYYIPKRSTLDDLMLKLGKTGNHEGPMPRFICISKPSEGAKRTKIILHGPGKIDPMKFPLEDGILLTFPETTW